MSRDNEIHKSSNNIFEDLGLPHPDRVLARSQVMWRIAEIIKASGLTQKEAAKTLDIPQSKVSCLMNGKLSSFSLDLLFTLLNRLGRNVEIVITAKTPKQKFAKTQVLALRRSAGSVTRELAGRPISDTATRNQPKQ